MSTTAKKTEVSVCGLWHDGETLIAFFDNDEGEAMFRAVLSLDRAEQQRIFFALVEDFWKIGERAGNAGATRMIVTKVPPHIEDNFIAYHTHALGPRFADVEARFPTYPNAYHPKGD